jgi:hypothetical protein
MARVLYVLLGGAALVGGAVFAFLVAGVTNWLACENEGTPACARQELAFWQWVVSMVGFVPIVVLVLAAAFEKHRLARVALAVGVAVYIAWAVLLDAAVHGWDDLKLLP